MNSTTYAIYLLIMAGVTYIIRVLPFVCFKGKVTNKFFKSFLAYVPYSVLAAMTFPAILYSSKSMIASFLGFAVAVICAYCGKSLMKVACATCATIFLAECILQFI